MRIKSLIARLSRIVAPTWRKSRRICVAMRTHKRTALHDARHRTAHNLGTRHRGSRINSRIRPRVNTRCCIGWRETRTKKKVALVANIEKRVKRKNSKNQKAKKMAAWHWLHHNLFIR